MEFKFNVTGARRKELVVTIGAYLDRKPVYKGAPTFAYAVGDCIIDKNGTLSGAVSQALLDTLTQNGFVDPDNGAAFQSAETAEPASMDVLTISVPKADFTETAIDNLQKLISSKASLMKKAFGTAELPLDLTEDAIGFPWFPFNADADEVSAYTKFVAALCKQAQTLNRVNAVEKETDNEKYAFRCYLLRLGFIGAEYKQDRKVLLKNLSGNGAFKSGSRKPRAESTLEETPARDGDAYQLVEALADAELVYRVNQSFESEANSDE